MNRLHLGLILLVPIVALTLAFAGTPRVAAAEPGLSGAVTNLADGAPIAGATVGVDGRRAVTDANGRYSLVLPPGTYHVRVEADAFIGMTERYRRVAEGATTSLDIRMVPVDPSPEEERAIVALLLDAAPSLPADEQLPPAFGPDLASVSRAPETIRVLMSDGYAVTMALDEYLQGVVPHEVPPNWPLEALKAQAVAARSYAATAQRHASGDPETDANVCTTTHCQVWSPTHYDTTDRAIEETRGVVATYDGAVIQAYFHAHCDGHTRNVEDVWGGSLPYLRGVECPCGFDTLSGHGVGLCQWGAKELAEQGRDYREILQHYYQGIAVTAPEAGHITAGSVVPVSGDTNTTFVFAATYTSGRDALPAAAHVIVAGRSYALRRVSSEGATPQVFQASVRLPAGAHDARLYVDDGYGTISTYDLSAPTVASAGAAPTPSAVPTETVIVHSTSGDWSGGAFDDVQADASVGDGALRLNAGRDSGVYTSAVITAPMTFVALGAEWRASTPSGGSLAWEVRTRADGASWSAWRTLTLEEDDGRPHTTMGADLVLGAADALQYRLTLEAGGSGQSPVVENVSWVCLDTRNGPDATTLADAHVALSGEPAIISRAAWGADESLMTRPPEYRTVRAVIVHHTVTDNGGVDPAAIVRAIYRYHAIYREKGDIGYNYLVDHLGNVYEGRYGGPGVVGSHAGYYDYGSLGVSVIGDHSSVPIPSAAMSALVRLLASRCATYHLDPVSQSFFVTEVLPTIMGHRDCCATSCPGDAGYSQLPALRSQVLAEMGNAAPTITLASPSAGAAVRGVVAVRVQSNSAVSGLSLYVDGNRIEAREGSPGTTSATAWWNTTTIAEGPHQLRVVATNAAGQGEATVSVTVDNTPPASVWASVPPWSRAPRVTFHLSSADAASVQFSNGWAWEGESLEAQVGRVIADADASGGQARQARPEDGAGAWYGPYACSLPRGQSYEAVFRLETPDGDGTDELALLDVSDSQGLRILAERSLAAAEFPRQGVYDDFAVPFAYPGDLTTCTGLAQDGLEFRTWYRASGDLSLDRVTLWSAPAPLTSAVSWTVRPQDGPQTVTVRFLDAAGNPTDRDVSVRVDSTPPTWIERGTNWAAVRDTISGLAPASAAYSDSRDDGLTWSTWQPITITASLGVTTTVRLEAPATAGPLARFKINDVAGNTSWSDSAEIILPVIAKR